MRHQAIDQVMRRATLAKIDSDFTYFFDLLLVAEALAKTITLGMLAAINDDKDRNRYRIEHSLIRADGLGEWARAIEDVLTGPASQYLLADAYLEQTELTKLSRSGEWQFDCVNALRDSLTGLGIEAEELPAKSDMKRWFRLLSTLRNKTRGHGATRSGSVAAPALNLQKSIDLLYQGSSLFQRPWVAIRRNISGKYRVYPISGNTSQFEYLKKQSQHVLQDGVYLWWGSPRFIPLIQTESEVDDFYFVNGGLSNKRFELLSYATDNKKTGDATTYSVPPGTLPSSETHGHGELVQRDQCLSNGPPPLADYIERPTLESELRALLLDDKRPIVTLRGMGGIGKTSLALRVLEDIYKSDRYVTVVWLSARDVDLQQVGPKPVRPNVISPEDMGTLYSKLVLSEPALSVKTFKPRAYLESQLQKCDSGACLFVLDNFETTQNPLEMFSWIDTFIRLPNKVLITTRLRDFKGDYPVDVSGMTEDEARALIDSTASQLGVRALLGPTYTSELVRQSEGHPYVIKILLGEVAKNKQAGSIPHLIAGSDEMLTALFERTYSALSPCAQRAFLTLAAWTSSVPRLALEAVLLRSTQERYEVQAGVETLIQYSLAESHTAAADGQEFIVLPLVAALFGRRKLNISPSKTSINADVEILQMLGPSRRDDLRLGLSKKLETFVSSIAVRVEAGRSFSEFEPILEMICRHFSPGWLLLARWHIESESAEAFIKAKAELTRFLESEPKGKLAADAWRLLAYTCFRTGDTLGEVHAFIERAQIDEVPFNDISNTANRLNGILKEQGYRIHEDEKKALANKLATVMQARVDEADADDLSRMAWLAINLGQESKAHQYVREGLNIDSSNLHCQRLANRLGIT